ncbi:MAG: PAS domain S-box protein [Planctomycetota bacterium]
MRWLSTRARLSIGLVAITISVYFLAVFFKLVPAGENAIANKRKLICQKLAISTSLLVARHDYRSIRAIYEQAAKHHNELMSVGLRKSNGDIVCQTKKHAELWGKVSVEQKEETQAEIKIRRSNQEWGTLELKFKPFFGSTETMSSLSHPWMKLALFLTTGCFIMFNFYLKKMLNTLNPTKSVPNRVRSALNTFTEAIMLLDTKGRIVLANGAFEKIAGIEAEKLVGQKPEVFVWLDPDGDEMVDFPWEKSTIEGNVVTDHVIVMPRIQGAIQKEVDAFDNIPIHLRDDRILKPNCTPFMG